MTKFKVGDIVVGNQDSEINGVEQGQLYEVVATAVEGGYDYIKTDLSLGCWVRSERFDLYKAVPYQEEQDDPLPPAPESVRYNEGAGGFPFEVKSLRANEYHPNRIRLGVLCGDREITHKYVVLDPDSALQLAHDLNRMANEIKRKEKQNA